MLSLQYAAVQVVWSEEWNESQRHRLPNLSVSFGLLAEAYQPLSHKQRIKGRAVRPALAPVQCSAATPMTNILLFMSAIILHSLTMVVKLDTLLWNSERGGSSNGVGKRESMTGRCLTRQSVLCMWGQARRRYGKKSSQGYNSGFTMRWAYRLCVGSRHYVWPVFKRANNDSALHIDEGPNASVRPQQETLKTAIRAIHMPLCLVRSQDALGISSPL